ncbi:unnamed protein product [Diabrotica balteata]|uniref:Cyclin-dependent kinase 2-interacting protein n=1 Tax=Diabrotica balteata TaxID=107213 RepID=A0A9N9T433_DIABA|nr:unnamed protein product [Diabrotica balteata]
MQNKTGTPSKFQPLQLPQSPVASSPNKNLTGSPRVVRDIAADLYNTIQSWNSFYINGAQIVKQIAILKADNMDVYSTELEEYTNALYTCVQGLKQCEEKLQLCKHQLCALQKVGRKLEPLFISLNINEIVDLVDIIVNSYVEEFKVKEIVLENIAHAKNKDEVMFFAACWTLQPNITDQINLKVEALLVETGHKKAS